MLSKQYLYTLYRVKYVTTLWAHCGRHLHTWHHDGCKLWFTSWVNVTQNSTPTRFWTLWLQTNTPLQYPWTMLTALTSHSNTLFLPNFLSTSLTTSQFPSTCKLHKVPITNN